MDAQTIAITLDLAGWGLWFALTRLLTAADKPVEGWITVDYTVSTALLAGSTFCTVAGAFLADPVLLTRIGVLLAIAGLGALAVRHLRSARTVRLQYTSDAAQAPQAAQWTTVTTPPPAARRSRPAPAQAGGIFTDPLIQDIEARRMTA